MNFPFACVLLINHKRVTIDYVGGIDFDVNDPNNAELVKLYRRFEQYANEANTVGSRWGGGG